MRIDDSPPGTRTRQGNAAMYHYTWGVNLLDPNDGNKMVWSWDKRAYTAAQHSFKIPPVPMPPSVDEIVSRGLMQHYPQKKRMTRELAETFHQMLGAPTVREATRAAGASRCSTLTGLRVPQAS